MRIYRVQKWGGGEHGGYEYFSRLRDARRYAEGYYVGSSPDDRPSGEIIERGDFPVTGVGMLAALNHWGRHPDNG